MGNDRETWACVFYFNGTADKCHTIPDDRDALIENFHKKEIIRIISKPEDSEGFYLERQLSWIGKEYNKSSWIKAGTEPLKEFLIQHKDLPLVPKEFARNLLAIFKAMPQPPTVIKKDVSRYKDGKLPGKDKIEKALEELDLHYKIISAQKQENGVRKTIWYLNHDLKSALLQK